MVKTIYIHGYRSNWLPNPPPPPTGIDGDPVLAPHGYEQAKELCNYLKDCEPRIQRIYSSPYYRCLETCLPLAKHLDQEIFIENGCGEWFKKKRVGGIPTPATPAFLHTFFERVNTEYESVGGSSPMGEDAHDIHARGIRVVKGLVEDLDRNYSNIDTILITTHAATKIVLGRALLKDPNFDVRAGCCSVDIYQRLDTAADDWTCTQNGRFDFLKDGEEMNWNFENGFEAGSNEDIENRRRIALATKVDS